MKIYIIDGLQIKALSCAAVKFYSKIKQAVFSLSAQMFKVNKAVINIGSEFCILIHERNTGFFSGAVIEHSQKAGAYPVLS